MHALGERGAPYDAPDESVKDPPVSVAVVCSGPAPMLSFWNATLESHIAITSS